MKFISPMTMDVVNSKRKRHERNSSYISLIQLSSTEDGKRCRRDIELNNVEEMNNIASPQIDDDTEPIHNDDEGIFRQ